MRHTKKNKQEFKFKIYFPVKRILDIFLSIVFIFIFFLPMVLISILIKINSYGPVLFWSKRIGKDDVVFSMPKFRTMKYDTPVVPSEMIIKPDLYITNHGNFLRKFSLDELPQIYNIIKGEMSFVGPRPALFNQDYLIKERRIKRINKLLPGLTGWAQINGRDNITINQKIQFDEEYYKNANIFLDLKILLITFFVVIKSSGIKH
tara:strand:- start:687 stop:1301 length:615 start_codon:yes stop_codon:yes gene_type:complete